MLDNLYDFYRSGAGFALMLTGLALLIEPERLRVRRSFGALNFSVGTLFCLSALDPVMHLPVDLGNLLIANLIFVLSQATYAMVLFLFGGQKRRGLSKKVFRIGLVWSQLVWLLPLLDGVLGLPAVEVSIEDGNSLQPLHLVGSFLIYAWPLFACFLSLRHSRWRLSDLPLQSRDSRHVRNGIYVVLGILSFILLAVVIDSRILYRVGQFCLQTFMLVWYFIMMRNPLALRRIRRVIHDNHERKNLMDADEADIIATRLGRLIAEGAYLRSDLSLAVLAQLIRMPAYRLSFYFNEHLKTSFPAWLNELRISWVCGKMAAQPEVSLLDLALQAGFGGKTTFNNQFFKLKGVSPSEYRKSL